MTLELFVALAVVAALDEFTVVDDARSDLLPVDDAAGPGFGAEDMLDAIRGAMLGLWGILPPLGP